MLHDATDATLAQTDAKHAPLARTVLSWCASGVHLWTWALAVKMPQDIMVLVTKFFSLGDTPSFTPFRIPGGSASTR